VELREAMKGRYLKTSVGDAGEMRCEVTIIREEEGCIRVSDRQRRSVGCAWGVS
jgi:hypothetical protein